MDLSPFRLQAEADRRWKAIVAALHKRWKEEDDRRQREHRENCEFVSRLNERNQALQGGNWLDHIQTGLDVVGLIPVVGELADGANAVISVGRGDYVAAGLSLASMIPVVGDAVGKGGKIVRRGAGLLDDVAESVLKRVDDCPTARKPSAQIRKEWEEAHGKPWPKDPATGANQDVTHKKPLADGGTNNLDNVEPLPHGDHVQHHKDAGDFKRWGGRRGKNP